jgi:hypothetical protein
MNFSNAILVDRKSVVGSIGALLVNSGGLPEPKLLENHQ